MAALRHAGIVLVCSCICCPMVWSSRASAQPEGQGRVEYIQSKAGRLKIEKLATLREPWGLAYLPDGRLLITEKPGRLRVFADGKLGEPVAGVPRVVHHQQGGLLDVEVDPRFAANGLVYLSFTEASDEKPREQTDTRDTRIGPDQDLTDVVVKGTAVVCGRLEGNQLRDVKVIWRQEPKTLGRNHFGGRLCFSRDGTLFITSGDRQRFDPAQDMSGNLGKVVRINADGTIPSDNPFVNKEGAKADLWSIGHRNPLGAAIHPETGKLWINEMGPKHGDEINIPEAGKDYGWPAVSHGDHYDGQEIPDHGTRPEFEAPVYHWYPAVSPSGMMFYTGDTFQGWKGNLFVGGLSSETLLRLTLEGEQVKEEERIGVQRRIRDVIQSPDGAVLLLSEVKQGDGDLLRLTPG